MDAGLKAAVAAVGTRYRLSKMIGVTPSSVLKWKTIPIGRLADVERVTGLPREALRPDLYQRGRMRSLRNQRIVDEMVKRGFLEQTGEHNERGDESFRVLAKCADPEHAQEFGWLLHQLADDPDDNKVPA